MSQDVNVLRYDCEKVYEENKLEWTVRFIYLMSGRLYSRKQVRDRLSYLSEIASAYGTSEWRVSSTIAR